MNASSLPTTRRTRRTRNSVLLSSAVVLLLTQQGITPADCFQTATAYKSSSSARTGRTAVHFRNEQALHETHVPFVPTSSVTSSSSADGAASRNSHLPTWLTVPRSHLAVANKQALQKAMRDSFFTESETLQVLYAIEEATKGDKHKVAGAAEFLFILVESMEMGLDALTAAAYHYAACVTAREHAGEWQPLDAASQAALESFGSHTVEIAQDAARLKQLEVVFQTVMQQDASRVRPDATDAENLRKLLTSETHNWRALAIRSAACLYRLRGLQSTLSTGARGASRTASGEAARTAREALTIYAPLASRLGMHRLKNELEGAAFQILYPRQHELVYEMTHSHSAGHDDIGASMKHVLDTAQQEMTSMLQQDAQFTALVQDFSVTARFKEPFSLWRKMLKRGYKHISQVPDALALRIVLTAKKETADEDPAVTRARERALCYYAQRLCMTSRWQPDTRDARLKDYIQHPKPNGYQSLHYTAGAKRHGQDWTVEIQIRSGEMHQVAEYGMAGHWEYKLQQAAQQQEQPPSPMPSTEHIQVQIQQDGHEIDNSDLLLQDIQEWHWKQHGDSSSGSSQAESVDASPASASGEDDHRWDRMRERTERLQPYIQALTEAQSDLARDYVFVFVERNECSDDSDPKFLALPAGARVSDALRETGLTPTTLDKCLGGCPGEQQPLVVNGSAVQMTSLLHNGDVLALSSSSTRAAAVCS